MEARFSAGCNKIGGFVRKWFGEILQPEVTEICGVAVGKWSVSKKVDRKIIIIRALAEILRGYASHMRRGLVLDPLPEKMPYNPYNPYKAQKSSLFFLTIPPQFSYA